MLYTKYFSILVRDQGMPNLSTSSFQKFMNVVVLEGQLEGLKKAKTLDKENPEKYGMELFKIGRQLTEITGNLEPNEFLTLLLEIE